MRTRKLLLIPALASTLLLSGALLMEAGPARADGHEQGEEDMANAMGRMNRAVRVLHRQIDDPARNADSIERISEFQTHALVSKSLRPYPLLDAADDDPRLAAYRSLMIDLIEESLTLERALIEGRNDDARAALSRLMEIQDAGHEAFIE